MQASRANTLSFNYSDPSLYPMRSHEHTYYEHVQGDHRNSATPVRVFMWWLVRKLSTAPAIGACVREVCVRKYA